MARRYPIHIDINLQITDGVNYGTVKYGFPLNMLPREEDMEGVISSCMEALPDGYRLMTRHESLIFYLRQEKGYRGSNNLAMPELPEGDEWHDPATAEVYAPSDEVEYEEEE